TKAGPSRRAAAGRPVCAGPGRRRSKGSTLRSRVSASRRARSSAWSKPRDRRRAVVVGAHVATAGRWAGSGAAIAPAGAAVAECAPWYLARAISSRAVPAYENGANHASTPRGGGPGEGLVIRAAQRGQTGSPANPQPGQRSGKTVLQSRAGMEGIGREATSRV